MELTEATSIPCTQCAMKKGFTHARGYTWTTRFRVYVSRRGSERGLKPTKRACGGGQSLEHLVCMAREDAVGTR